MLSSNADAPAGANVSRSLTVRLDQIKGQYKKELVPLKQEREALQREIAELKTYRDLMLEETTSLGARNEELAQLSAQYARRMETIAPPPESPGLRYETLRGKNSTSFDRARTQAPLPGLPQSFSSSTTTTVVGVDDTLDVKKAKQDVESVPSGRGKFIKWPGTKPVTTAVSQPDLRSVTKGNMKTPSDHFFLQVSVLRFTRCDHCGEKLWGSQLRCSSEYCARCWYQR